MNMVTVALLELTTMVTAMVAVTAVTVASSTVMTVSTAMVGVITVTVAVCGDDCGEGGIASGDDRVDCDSGGDHGYGATSGVTTVS